MSTFSAIALALVLLPLCSSCKTEGDAVINRTAAEIKIVLVTMDGARRELVLARDNVFAFSRGAEEQLSYKLSSVQAFRLDGAKIGELDRADVPNGRGRYGTYYRFVILDEGIYPLPAGSRAVEARIDREQLERVLQAEREYERGRGGTPTRTDGHP